MISPDHKSPHTVLFVHGKSELGGSDFSLLCLLKGLDRERFRAIVVVPARGPLTAEYEKHSDRLIVMPLSVVRTTANPLELGRILWRLFPSVLRLRRIIRDEQVSIVHSNSMVSLTAPLAARLAGVRCVVHVREIIVSHRFIAGTLLRIQSLLADRFIAISEAVRRALPGNLPRSDRVSVIYNGVDTDLFRPDLDGSAFRREFGISEDTPLVGVVGRVVYCKGVDCFVEAIPAVVGAVPFARFVVVGNAPTARHASYEQEVRNRADALGLNGVLTFCGPRRDIHQVTAALDILVLASREPEGMGRVLVEAMACGKPVVATNHGGPVEVVEDGLTGILVPPSDPRALAAALIVLTGNRALAREMGRRGREDAVRRFSLIRNVKEVERLYEEMLGLNGRGEHR